MMTWEIHKDSVLFKKSMEEHILQVEAFYEQIADVEDTLIEDIENMFDTIEELEQFEKMVANTTKLKLLVAEAKHIKRMDIEIAAEMKEAEELRKAAEMKEAEELRKAAEESFKTTPFSEIIQSLTKEE